MSVAGLLAEFAGVVPAPVSVLAVVATPVEVLGLPADEMAPVREAYREHTVERLSREAVSPKPVKLSPFEARAARRPEGVPRATNEFGDDEFPEF